MRMGDVTTSEKKSENTFLALGVCFLQVCFFFFGFARALAAGLPCQNNTYKTTYESFRFYSKFFDEMCCKLDSTENPRSLQKYPTPPSYLTVTFFLFWF